MAVETRLRAEWDAAVSQLQACRPGCTRDFTAAANRLNRWAEKHCTPENTTIVSPSELASVSRTVACVLPSLDAVNPMVVSLMFLVNTTRVARRASDTILQTGMLPTLTKYLKYPDITGHALALAVQWLLRNLSSDGIPIPRTLAAAAISYAARPLPVRPLVPRVIAHALRSVDVRRALVLVHMFLTRHDWRSTIDDLFATGAPAKCLKLPLGAPHISQKLWKKFDHIWLLVLARRPEAVPVKYLPPLVQHYVVGSNIRQLRTMHRLLAAARRAAFLSPGSALLNTIFLFQSLKRAVFATVFGLEVRPRVMFRPVLPCAPAVAVSLLRAWTQFHNLAQLVSYAIAKRRRLFLENQ